MKVWSLWRRQGLISSWATCSLKFNLALALLCQGNTEDAKIEYQKGLEMADSKSLEVAITDLKEALEKDPSLPEAREILTQLEEARA